MNSGFTNSTQASPPAESDFPRSLCLPINRCNLPAKILGSLIFQQHPIRLYIDGVQQLHGQLFETLNTIDSAEDRAVNFHDYMRAGFLLDNLDDAGLNINGSHRGKADYIRLLRGWMFNADGVEAAVLKGWVESRFGLLTRHHLNLVTDYNGHTYQLFQAMRATGLYNTNALEAQLDLLYSFCQYELARRQPHKNHLFLYRGSNNFHDYRHSRQTTDDSYRVVLNNLNSFTDNPAQADSFGDYIFEGSIPCAKVLYFPGLLPGVLKGESEYLVLGGLYQLQLYRHL